ncbi:sulfurtransferase complex subunit TusB [Marinobacter sp. CHS3-4]|uniref:sulfurtransferase complex subunit TusB n=1 Tax=Marinobacter sp. CHS3-4 TaxID=3045174 RepID=UPI0024B51F6B|nr:sulfurtransferase complex subunit TusB [Marinobacter sp. CHS3-4]MDI9245463.1 sulfurtransferase complex subunit TusB [Marinobacter sp. CHS3-4]
MAPIHTLHILNKTPGHQRHEACLAALGPQDALVLIENGVLALAKGLDTDVACYALMPDASARGIEDPASEVTMVSFDDMVALTSAAENVISW